MTKIDKTTQCRSDAIENKYLEIQMSLAQFSTWKPCVVDTFNVPSTIFYENNCIPVFQFGSDEWQNNINGVEYKFARNQVNGKYYIVSDDEPKQTPPTKINPLKNLGPHFIEVTDPNHIAFLDKEYKKGHCPFIFP